MLVTLFPTRLLLVALFLGVQNSLLAGPPVFSVTLVGAEQVRVNPRDTEQPREEIWPVIHVPARSRDDWEPMRGSDRKNFYVVIRNVSQQTVCLNYDNSDWYDCLDFTLAAGNGKTFSIHRHERDWLANSLEPWMFPPDGLKIIPVDFSEGWDDLPSFFEMSRGRPCKIKAIFKVFTDRVTDAVGNKKSGLEQTCESKPTDVKAVF